MNTTPTIPNKIRTKLLKLIDYEIQLNDSKEYNIPLKSFFLKSEKPTFQINIEENYSATNNYVYFICNNNSDKKKGKTFRDCYKCMGNINYSNLKEAKLTHNIISTQCIQTSNSKKSKSIEKNENFSFRPFGIKNNISNEAKNTTKYNPSNDIININNKFYLVKRTNESSKAFIIEKTTDSERYLIDLCNRLKKTGRNKKKQNTRICSLDFHFPKKDTSPKKFKIKFKKVFDKTILTNKLKHKIRGSNVPSPKKIRRDSCSFLDNHQKIFPLIGCRMSDKLSIFEQKEVII